MFLVGFLFAQEYRRHFVLQNTSVPGNPFPGQPEKYWEYMQNIKKRSWEGELQRMRASEDEG